MNLKKSIIKESTPEEVQKMLKNKEIDLQDIDDTLDELWFCCDVNECENKAEWIVEFSEVFDPVQCINIQKGTLKMCDYHHQLSLSCGNYKNSKKINEENGVEKAK